MKECIDGRAQDHLANAPTASLAAGLDWHAVASQRLRRLVQIEHSHALLASRHEALQVDHRGSVCDDIARLQRIRDLEHQCERWALNAAALEGRITALSQAQAAFLGSRSWRMTRPMRAVARWMKNPRLAAKNGLLLLARSGPVRRVFKVVLRLTPAVRSRVEAFMYPRATK
jgi:hypothetical protein